MANKQWTHSEERTLTMAVGAFGKDYLLRNLPVRSQGAIYARLRKEFGPGGMSRGTKSLREVARETGYDIRQIKRAGRALDQRWTRTSRTGRVMLSDDQVDAILGWLKHDYWCRISKVYACVSCGRSDRRPNGLGLDHTCYQAWLRKFARADLPFGREGLLRVVRLVFARTPKNARDWLEAFELSLLEGCVLTRGTMERLLEHAAQIPRHERRAAAHAPED